MDTTRFFLRPATLQDIPALKKCATICFCQTHIDLGQPADDMEQYAEKAYDLDVLTREVSSPNAHYHLVIDRTKLPDSLQPIETDAQSTTQSTTENSKDEEVDRTDDCCEDYIVGYCKLTWGSDQTDESFRENPTAIQQQRLYVLPTYHGFKLGKALQQWAIDFATNILPKKLSLDNPQQQQPKFSTMWLTTHPINHVAINFYIRWGFEVTGEYYFDLGDRRERNHIMELKLSAFDDVAE